MPPRRSKRLKTSKDSEPPHRPQPKTKKASQGSKSTPTARYKQVGRSRAILDMPLDIIHEIFIYDFHPRDLLSLKRTSKAFHGFLMRPSSARLWKEALKTIEGLPSCPTRLIEPAWAALVFSPSCTVCGQDTSNQVIWAFLVRLCNKCMPKVVMDKREFLRNRISNIPNIIFTTGNVSDYSGPFWLRSEQRTVVVTWASLPKDKARWDLFVKEKIKEVEALHEFQKSCLTWFRAEEEERRRVKKKQKAEAQRIRDDRHASIVLKLRALGWGPELDMLQQYHDSRLKEHKIVAVAKPLDDRSWSSMQSKLTAFMQIIRDERLKRELVERLNRRWSIFMRVGPKLRQIHLKAHPELRGYGLNVADLAHMPEIFEIISSPDSTKVNERSFEVLLPRMDAIVEGWRSRTCEALRKKVRAKTEYPEDVEPLGLATTIFACGTCTQSLIFFPDILTHSCQRPKYLPGEEALHYHAAAQKPQTQRFGDENIGYLLALSLREYERSEEAWYVVQLCGKDPLRTTVREMDGLGVRLVQDNAIMTWRAAIIEQTQFNHSTSSWRVATLDEATGAMHAEKKLLQSAGKERGPMYANGLFKLKLPKYQPMRLSAHRSR